MVDTANPGAHRPVMLEACVEGLAIRPDGVYVDGTFGRGGHSARILAKLGPAGRLLATDRDPAAVAVGRGWRDGRFAIEQSRFSDLCAVLDAHGIGGIDGVLLDLGVSSPQLDDPSRGFSFRADGPLDMRMEKSGPSAADLVNTRPEAELADILFHLGEERFARRIARAIVERRKEQPFTTTGDLAALVRSKVPRDPSGIDGATRSFQALRLAVNDELGEVERGLAAAARLLAPGGRLVVVAFHSLEDRIAKRFMAEAAGRAGGASRHDPAALTSRSAPRFRLITSRALRPTEAETATNPRARSARLRALERLEEAA